MVCINCGTKTKISNSRFNVKTVQTWRRHTCTQCRTMFTTRELIDSSVSYRVKRPDSSLQPVMRELLFVSVHESLSHRKDAPEAAAALTDTIFGKIHANKSLIIDITWLTSKTHEILNRFDKPAAVRYKAIYMS